MASNTVSIIVSARDRATSTFRRLNGQIRESTSRWQRYGRLVDRQSRYFANAIFSMNTAVAAFAGAAGLGYMIKRTLDATAEIERFSEMSGLGVEAFQELSYAASKYQITQDALTDGFKELNLRTDEYVQTGAGPAAESFKRLGFNQRELNKLLDDTPALFKEIIKRMEGLDEAAQIRIADELFGGQGGEQFVAMIRGGAEALDEFRSEARDMGVVMDRDLVRQSVEAKKKIDELTRVLGVQLQSAVADLAPEIADLVGEMADWVKNNKKFLTQDVPGQISEMATAVGDFVNSPEFEAISEYWELVAGAVVGGKIGGPVGALIGAGAGGYYSAYKDIKELQKLGDVGDSKAANLAEKLYELRENKRKILEAIPEGEDIIDYPAQHQGLQDIQKEIDATEAKLREFYRQKQKQIREDKENQEKPKKETDTDVETGGALPEPITGQIREAVKIQSEMSRALAKSKTDLAELEALYKQNAINVTDYYQRRREIVLETIDREIAGIRRKARAQAEALRVDAEAAENEEQRAKLLTEAKEVELKAEDEIIRKKEERKQKILDLEQAEREAQERMKQEELRQEEEKQDLLAEIQGRANEEGGLREKHESELAALRSKHEQELEELRDFGASKLEILQTQAVQEKEIENLKAEHHRQLLQKRLTWAEDFVSGMADSMYKLYENGLARNKQMFEVYKAFAVAQAMIDTYKSAQEAYSAMASIPYVGPALGAAAAAAAIAAGMARVAAIKSAEPQGYAYGGEIDGPRQGDRADNVTIKATPGEYMMDRPTVRHYGVRVMEALRQRAIPKELFSGFALPAMRPAYAGMGFAEGGQVGAGAGVPDRKQKKEPVNIVNVLDPKMFDKYMASTGGQRTVLNVISQNASKVNKALGNNRSK